MIITARGEQMDLLGVRVTRTAYPQGRFQDVVSGQGKQQTHAAGRETLVPTQHSPRLHFHEITISCNFTSNFFTFF